VILTHDQIIEAQQAGEIKIDPFERGQVQGASYDLRVGAQGITTSEKAIRNIETEGGYLALKPGDFGIVTTYETLALDKRHTGRLGLRSRYAREGIVATVGTQIDPGFRGRLFVGLMNLTPRLISLPFKDDFLTIEFHRLEHETTHPYVGPYQDKVTLLPEDIKFVTQTEGMAFSEVLTTLRSLSQNVGALTTQMSTFASQMKTLFWVVGLGSAFVGIVVAIFAAVVGLHPGAPTHP
jgi:dCTP deaminase